MAGSQLNPVARYVEPAQRVMYTVPEAAALIGIGRSTAYSLILSGELPSVKLGARRFISPSVLEGIIGERPPLPGQDRLTTPADTLEDAS